MEISEEGISYFKYIFKMFGRENIDKIFEMVSFSPCFTNEYKNDELMKEITKSYLEVVLHIFQKDKISGMDGLSIELY